MRAFLLSAVALVSSVLPVYSALKSEHSSFSVGTNQFLLDGKPYVIKAAELHYPRIPRPYWEHRIRQCKALGMNTVCIYVFWNIHEQTPGAFDFEGQNDVAEFIRLCQKNGMNVILRPGPYVCAEWEMGGLPWWLLKKEDISLRDTDPYFMERVRIFQSELADRLKGLTISEGGPILMIQVENEYGSYGYNKPYVSAIRDILRQHYPTTTLFQCDWNSNFEVNGLDDLLWCMNFGTGADIDSQFARLKELRPESPLMCSEYWSGWFDKWGASHETRPAADMVTGIDEMLSKNISFSLYMTHGGTNWGHWAGANSPGYSPDVTSYDYDAPIDEAGRITEKYNLLRELLAKYSGEELPAPEEPLPVITVPSFSLTQTSGLSGLLGNPVTSDSIRPMESFDQGFGSILYSTDLPAIKEGTVLTVTEPHDFAQVFINGTLVGTLDRRNNDTEIVLSEYQDGAKLDILVEATGRINFGRAIKDYKGITESVTLTYPHGIDNLKGWKVYLLPDEYDFYYSTEVNNATDVFGKRGVYKGRFNVDSPGDTYLNFETWGKGLAYVNGHALGRFWSIGPQQTLYTPGCWLKEGENELLVFDIVGPQSPVVEGLADPIVNELNIPTDTLTNAPDINEEETQQVYEGRFEHRGGWQNVTFNEYVKARYLCFKAINGYDDSACIAELYAVSPAGERLPREKWTVAYADSEAFNGNHTADKIFDLQESTYWAAKEGSPFPYTIVIDMGEEALLRGIEYLPRMENGTPGAIRDYIIYAK